MEKEAEAIRDAALALERREMGQGQGGKECKDKDKDKGKGKGKVEGRSGSRSGGYVGLDFFVSVSLSMTPRLP